MTNNSNTLVKARLAKQFSKAAKQYNDAAQVQLDIAFDLLQQLPENLGRCADLGCGTGRITAQLSRQSDTLLGIDLALGMLQYAQQQNPDVQWLAGDAEQLPLANQSIDNLISSMALQWCNPIDKAMAEIYRVLKPGGKAYLALLCDGALFELSQSWLAVDDIPRVNPFQTSQVLQDAARQIGFSIKAKQKQYLTFHQDVPSVLNSIRQIGASHVPRTGNKASLNRAVLQQLQDYYVNTFGQAGKLPLRYEVAFLELTK